MACKGVQRVHNFSKRCVTSCGEARDGSGVSIDDRGADQAGEHGAVAGRCPVQAEALRVDGDLQDSAWLSPVLGVRAENHWERVGIEGRYPEGTAVSDVDDDPLHTALRSYAQNPANVLPGDLPMGTQVNGATGARGRITPPLMARDGLPELCEAHGALVDVHTPVAREAYIENVGERCLVVDNSISALRFR